MTVCADFVLGGGFAFGVGFAFDVDFAFGDAASGPELAKPCSSVLSTAAFAFS